MESFQDHLYPVLYKAIKALTLAIFRQPGNSCYSTELLIASVIRFLLPGEQHFRISWLIQS